TITSLTSPAAINENDALTLTGTFHDPGTLDTHIIVIGWGAGEGTTTLTTADAAVVYLGGGNWSFSATHQYLDDNPTGTVSDTYTISVSVTDDDTGAGTASTSAEVKDVAPIVTSLSGPASINENDTYTLTATFHEPGTLDTHTIVISWGSGERATTI